MNTTTTKLSKRQIGDADRVGGIELMILWPDALGPAPAMEPDTQMESTPVAKAYAERWIREAMIAAGEQPDRLIPVHTRIACVHRPNSLPSPGHQVHIAVTLIGRRWVHASTRKIPRTMFAR